jgi:hypothetical protein
MQDYSDRPNWNTLLNGPYAWLWRWGMALIAIGVVAIFAFGRLFTTFAAWDDEGYFFQSYKDFLSGHALYSEVYGLYGPLTYFIAAIMAWFNPSHVTHDGFRWIWLGIWVVTAALMGGTVWRWTGRLEPALIAVLLVGLRLAGLAKSVGHPQAWILLAAAVLMWLGLDWILERDGWRNAFWTGVVIGAILLFKSNIGFFVLMGVGWAAALHWRGQARLLAFGLLGLLAVGLGVSILLLTPTAGDRYFVTAYLVALVAIVCVAAGRRAERQPETRTLVSLVVGVGACVFVGLAATLFTGTTPRSLLDGLVMIPANLAKRYHNGFKQPAGRYSLAICAGALPAGALLWWRKLTNASPAWIGLVQFLAGAGLLLAFSYHTRIPLTGSLLFLWLLIADGSRISARAYANRLLLALVALFFSLQFFPMSGEQVDWAGILPMTAAAVLVGDGMNCLADKGLPFRFWFRNRAARLVKAAAALLALYMFAWVGRSAFGIWTQWRHRGALNLPGTHWLRLPRAEEASFHAIVAEIDRNCQSVLTLPGLYSFSLWSGVPPSERMRVNSWPFLWSDQLQETELRRVREENRGCVLVNRKVYYFFRSLAVSPGEDRLLPEIRETMRPVFMDHDFTLYRSLK